MVLLFSRFKYSFFIHISTFSLYAFFKINAEIIAVNTSAIGKVHHTRFVTLSDKVNMYAIGNTKTTNLKRDIISGLSAYHKDCNTPCTATENPINIYPILAILNATPAYFYYFVCCSSR